MNERRRSLFSFAEELQNHPSCYERVGTGFWKHPWSSRKALEIQLSRASSEGARTPERATAQVDAIISKLPYPPATVVDLGSGLGHHAVAFAETGSEVRGIDISPEAIRFARQRASETGDFPAGSVEFLEGDFRELLWGDGGVDLALLLFGEFCLLTEEERVAFLRGSRAALKPGGYLVLELFEQETEAVPEEQSWEYSSGEGFWSEEPYLELNVTTSYPGEKTILHRFGLCFSDGSIREERIWESSINRRRLEEELVRSNRDGTGPALRLVEFDDAGPPFGEDEGELGRRWYVAVVAADGQNSVSSGYA